MISFEKLDSFIKVIEPVNSFFYLIGVDIDHYEADPYNLLNSDYSDYPVELKTRQGYQVPNCFSYKDIIEIIELAKTEFFFSLEKVEEEVRNNLYTLKNHEDRLIYTREVLKKFKNLYFLFDIHHDYNNYNGYPQNPISNCKLFLLDNIENKRGFIVPEYTVVEKFVLKCYFLYRRFSLIYRSLLYSFDIDLDTIQSQMEIYLSFREDPNRCLYFPSLSKFEKAFIKESVEIVPSENSTFNEDKLILSVQLIKELRLKFNDFWPNITEDDFLTCWLPGEKSKYLSDCIPQEKWLQFMYLYFTYLNPNLTPQVRNGTFKIIDLISENTFGKKNLKVDRGRSKKIAKDFKENIDKKFKSIIIQGYKEVLGNNR